MSIYYMNGTFVDSDHAMIPVGDLAVLRGYGAFDYLRTYGGKPFRLLANVQRLRRSCELIYLDYPWSDQAIASIVMETLARNALPEATIRILVTGGLSPDNITPTAPALIVMVTPLRAYPAEWYERGAKAITIRMNRVIPTAKSINYIPAIMALKHARDAGAIEALYLTDEDHVLEGTTMNVFAFIGDTLVTPSEPILPGITRSVVLELAQPVFPVAVRGLLRAELLHADEVFITSSNKQIVPVTQVDDTIIGSGQPGPKTRQMMALFKAETERFAAEAEPMAEFMA